MWKCWWTLDHTAQTTTRAKNQVWPKFKRRKQTGDELALVIFWGHAGPLLLLGVGSCSSLDGWINNGQFYHICSLLSPVLMVKTLPGISLTPWLADECRCQSLRVVVQILCYMDTRGLGIINTYPRGYFKCACVCKYGITLSDEQRESLDSVRISAILIYNIPNLAVLAMPWCSEWVRKCPLRAHIEDFVSHSWVQLHDCILRGLSKPIR